MLCYKVHITVAFQFRVRLRCCDHMSHGVKWARNMTNHMTAISYGQELHMCMGLTRLSINPSRNKGAGASDKI